MSSIHSNKSINLLYTFTYLLYTSIQTNPLYGLEYATDPMTEMKWHAAIFHIDEKHFDHIEEILLEYDIGGYLIGCEVEPFHHYHVLFEANDRIYNTFSKRLIEKYGLRGNAKKGKARQYGKIKKIEDLEKLKSYTIKDGNYRSNLTKSELDAYFAASFKKKNDRRHLEQMVDHINTLPETINELKRLHLPTEGPCFEDLDYSNKQEYNLLKYNIIKYYIEKDLNISRNILLSAMIFFIRRTDQLHIFTKTSLLFKLIN